MVPVKHSFGTACIRHPEVQRRNKNQIRRFWLRQNDDFMWLRQNDDFMWLRQNDDAARGGGFRCVLYCKLSG